MIRKPRFLVPSSCIALLALGCAQIDRSLGDTMGSGGSTSAGGSSSTGGSSESGGSSSLGGDTSIGGGTPTAGGTSIGGSPTSCDFPPEEPGTRYPPTSRAIAHQRISLFLADTLPSEPPASPTMLADDAWVREVALSLLDSFTGAAPGHSRFMATWMPEVGERELWASMFSGPLQVSDRMAGLFTWPATPTNPGILADPALLQAKPSISARGSWLLEHLFCTMVPEPPPDLPEPQTPPEGMTRREALEAEVASAPCAGCHRILDPLAYSLESYDEMGVFRTADANGLPIDSSGTYTTPMGEMFVFGGLTDVATQVGTSCEVARCLTRSLLTDAMRRSGMLDANEMADELQVSRIARNVIASDFSMREMTFGVAETLAGHIP